MTTHTWRMYPGVAATGFGLAGAAIYLLMVGITLAHIEEVSGDLPLDMRPFGYDPQDVARLFGALGEAGRSYYLTRQIPLDTVYPALLALTMVSILLWLGKRNGIRGLARIGMVLSVAAALFDYGENLGIALMIMAWPTIPDALVHSTSVATNAKSLLTSSAVLVILLGGALLARQRKADL